MFDLMRYINVEQPDRDQLQNSFIKDLEDNGFIEIVNHTVDSKLLSLALDKVHEYFTLHPKEDSFELDSDCQNMKEIDGMVESLTLIASSLEMSTKIIAEILKIKDLKTNFKVVCKECEDNHTGLRLMALEKGRIDLVDFRNKKQNKKYDQPYLIFLNIS